VQLAVDQPFDLAASLESGQAHRWAYPKAGDDGWYTGVIQGDLVRIRQTDKAVEFQCAPSSEADMAPRLASYFRLDDDIEAIYADINRNDETMAAIVSRYRGLRLLRQEPWECLVQAHRWATTLKPFTLTSTATQGWRQWWNVTRA
jgi:N-glycosylase/DNA lyase